MAEEPNACGPGPMDSYRDQLIKCQQSQIEQWDKTILWMASGALAISMAFIKDIVKPEKMVAVEALFGAWVCWTLSLVCVLTSFYTSACAMGNAIKQVDDQEILLEDEKGKKRPGGLPDWATRILNPSSGVLLVIGLACVIWFAYKNLKSASQEQQQKQPTKETYGRTT